MFNVEKYSIFKNSIERFNSTITELEISLRTGPVIVSQLPKTQTTNILDGLREIIRRNTNINNLTKHWMLLVYGILDVESSLYFVPKDVIDTIAICMIFTE